MRRIEGLAVVSAVWLIIAHLAAIPYIWAGIGFIDALFESMSGSDDDGRDHPEGLRATTAAPCSSGAHLPIGSVAWA